MFTGIVEEVGRVIESGEHRLVVSADRTLGGVAIGDSINVNGACLTVVDLTGESFAVDVVWLLCAGRTADATG